MCIRKFYGIIDVMGLIIALKTPTDFHVDALFFF